MEEAEMLRPESIHIPSELEAVMNDLGFFPNHLGFISPLGASTQEVRASGEGSFLLKSVSVFSLTCQVPPGTSEVIA